MKNRNNFSFKSFSFGFLFGLVCLFASHTISHERGNISKLFNLHNSQARELSDHARAVRLLAQNTTDKLQDLEKRLNKLERNR